MPSLLEKGGPTFEGRKLLLCENRVTTARPEDNRRFVRALRALC